MGVWGKGKETTLSRKVFAFPFPHPLEAFILTAFISGFGMGGGLIVAIGAQNAFVLTQGVRRNHHLAVAALCILCDALLISLGVTGMGTVVASNPVLGTMAAWGGSAFLLWYGYGAFRSALTGGSLDAGTETGKGLKHTLTLTLAVTLLNPHVYLDTIVFMGLCQRPVPHSGPLFLRRGRDLGLVLLVHGPDPVRPNPCPALFPAHHLAHPGLRGLPDHVGHRRHSATPANQINSQLYKSLETVNSRLYLYSIIPIYLFKNGIHAESPSSCLVSRKSCSQLIGMRLFRLRHSR